MESTKHTTTSVGRKNKPTKNRKNSKKAEVTTEPVAGPSNTSEEKVHDFCVICELEVLTSVEEHLVKFHERASVDPRRPCYEVVEFEGRRIVAPRGTFLDGERCELATCDTCSGVFYKHRVRNHLCGNHLGRSIYEGTGLHFCLMCQLKCDDVQEHASTVHHDNEHHEIYDVIGRDGTKIGTLMPQGVDFEREVLPLGSCPCGTCLMFIFKHRTKRICPFYVLHFEVLHPKRAEEM